MPYKITDVKTGKEKGTTYTSQDVGRMVKRTSKIPGSVLRKTTGLNEAVKLAGGRANKKTRSAMVEAVKKGQGGFTRLAGGRSK